ncbi:hypothetical protein BRL93_09275 [Xanthomonas oryzae pv. oryzae]|uniref:AAA family ATPase n=1 Tax=Xanthomonas oryzae TaxID=347 RepID=UPI000DDE1BD6|nr:AAA family ATPase [Xanthomonas oryzae]RBH91955.1 hypothetical protein BRL93_09275 [Xanthomonas oryzae pv. oryzae]
MRSISARKISRRVCLRLPRPSASPNVSCMDASSFRTNSVSHLWCVVQRFPSRLAPLIEKWGNSDWVGQGRDIPHGNDCPFCQQKLPEKFAEDLAKLLDGDRQARVDQVKLLAERYEATVGQIKVSVAQTFKNLFTIS